MNWFTYTVLIVAWMLVVIAMGAAITSNGSIRNPLVEAVSIVCITAMFLGLFVVLG